MQTIELRSDNAAGVTPEILAAIGAANAGTALAYGGDALTAELEAVVRRGFEHPTARVFPVTSGTAANALALSALVPAVGCRALPRHGARAQLASAASTSLLGRRRRRCAGLPRRTTSRIAARRAASGARRACAGAIPHHSQPSVLSLTQATDMGTIYTARRDRGARGARPRARAATSTSTALGSRTRWRRSAARPPTSPGGAGVDAAHRSARPRTARLSAEAIVVFDDGAAVELVYRTKRAGHVTSKLRFQSAQLIAYLSRRALAAHRGRRQRADGASSPPVSPALGVAFVNRPQVNMLFAEVADEAADRARGGGRAVLPDRARA